MNLGALLDLDFDLDLPISGGFGSSRDEAIIIHRDVPNDYVGVQNAILKCLGIGRGIKWKFLQQTLLEYEGRMLDQIKIETIQLTEEDVITQIENYYFDVTECMG